MKQILTTLTMIIFSIQTAFTCTIFSLYPKNQHWVGRTFDWSYGHGLIFTNKRNVTKTGLRLLPTDVSTIWTSKFGSVTFNQFGKEFPTGGMNEVGLMVDALELKSSVFPAADTRPSFNELQFIQYLLDNYSSIEKLEADLPNIRLAPVGSKLHYFTCDIKNCMTIEFIDGKLVTHSGEDLEISGLANSTYDDHLNFAREHVGFGGTKPINMGSSDSLDRFVKGNYKAKFIDDAKNPIQYVFNILQDVRGPESNRWQIIYNLSERTINFRTTAKLNLQRVIDLKQFDYNCQTPSYSFDLDSEFTGAINDKFTSFDPILNHAIIKKSVEMQKLPPPLADRLAIYPKETVCHSH